MATTLADLSAAVLRRLGDEAQSVWARAEVELHLRTAYKQLAMATRIFWDQVFAENLPPGFSCTQGWETAYETFTYGVAQMTFEEERRTADWDSMTGPATHTCPDEIAFLSGIGASTAMSATAELPDTVYEIDRAAWDERTMEATTPQRAARLDSRYQLTAGEPYAYTFRQDGIRTFRKIRVPNVQADTYTTTGSWGLLREPADITSVSITGTWGIARRLPGHFAMGWDSPWGAPRRVYRSTKNVRIDHWREGRTMRAADDVCELPDHYARYLRDYAQARCLGRKGTGQDVRLAAYYDQRWVRNVDRLKARVARTAHAHMGVLGADVAARDGMPPRPKLPWQYGQRTRP